VTERNESFDGAEEGGLSRGACLPCPIPFLRSRFKRRDVAAKNKKQKKHDRRGGRQLLAFRIVGGAQGGAVRPRAIPFTSTLTGSDTLPRPDTKMHAFLSNNTNGPFGLWSAFVPDQGGFAFAARR